MIPVNAVAPPPDFDQLVRKPGLKWLQTLNGRRPTQKEWTKNALWNLVKVELTEMFSGFCAYSAIKIATKGEVDHWLAKATHTMNAYDWDNFRIAIHEVNNWKPRKDAHLKLIDPLTVQPGWFRVNFFTGETESTEKLPQALRKKAINSIRLSNQGNLPNFRLGLMEEFRTVRPTARDLRTIGKIAPLVAESIEDYWETIP